MLKKGDKIRIVKPGRLNDLEGEVLSNNEMADKPLMVDLAPYGIWSFKLTDVSTKVVSLFDPEIIKGANELYNNVEKAKAKSDLNKPKRAYKKRSDKPKEIKLKRKYTKKAK